MEKPVDRSTQRVYWANGVVALPGFLKILIEDCGCLADLLEEEFEQEFSGLAAAGRAATGAAAGAAGEPSDSSGGGSDHTAGGKKGPGSNHEAVAGAAAA